MARVVLILAAASLMSFASLAQDRDSIQYIHGLPVGEEDTVEQIPADDLGPANKITPVSLDNLPRKLRKELERGSQYDGWKDTTIYYERNTGHYIVPVRSGDGVRIFGLTRQGRPVTYDEVVPLPE